MSEWDGVRDAAVGTPHDVWHDGLDETRLDAVDAGTLLRLVPEGLAAGDWVAAAAARRLGDPALISHLERHAAAGVGRFPGEVARALRALGGDPGPVLGTAIAALERGGWGDRMAAAITLRHLGDDDVIEALLTTVAEDPDCLVRYHAAGSLLHLGGIDPPDIGAHTGIFDDLSIGDREPNAAGITARHRAAAAALRTMLGRSCPPDSTAARSGHGR